MRLGIALSGCLLVLCIAAGWFAACGTTGTTVNRSDAEDATSRPETAAPADAGLADASEETGPPPPVAGPIAMPDASPPTDAHRVACGRVCSRLWRVTRGRMGKSRWVADCTKACGDHGSEGQLACLERVQTAEQLAACEAR